MFPATFLAFLVPLPLPHCALLKQEQLLISEEIQAPPRSFLYFLLSPLSPNQPMCPQLHPSIQTHLHMNLLQAEYKPCFILFYILSTITSS